MAHEDVDDDALDAPDGQAAAPQSVKLTVAKWINNLAQTIFQAYLLKSDVVSNIKIDASSSRLGSGDVLPGLARAAGLAWDSEGCRIWRRSSEFSANYHSPPFSRDSDRVSMHAVYTHCARTITSLRVAQRQN